MPSLEDGPSLDLTCCSPRVCSQRSSYTRQLITNASSTPYTKDEKPVFTTGSLQVEFTAKERDVEIGLDYFEARYYASAQGRFTAPDPYDINFEQQTGDPEEASTLFIRYIGQPQHWNHYSYALNSPLKYVDPDGLREYDTELLGKPIKVKISDDLRSPDGKKLKGML